MLTADQARKVDALKQGSHAFATMRSLAMRFNGVLHAGRAESLEGWTDNAVDSGLIPIMRFARVLRRDTYGLTHFLDIAQAQIEAEVEPDSTGHDSIG
jgi:hypothetical protein